ncbi:hypothetical protein D3C86_913010 [compost metagenome]
MLVDVVDRRAHGLVVDGLHALGGERARVLHLAIGRGLDHAAWREILHEGIVGILGPVRALGLFFGVQVVEVPEELVEAVVRRQVFVLVAQVVLAELRSGVALGLQRFGNGDIALLQADRGTGGSHLGQACAQRRLPGDEGRAARRAAVLGVIVREHHPFPGDPVDIGRGVAHHPLAIGADIGLADVIAKDHQDVRLLAGSLRLALLGRRSLGLRMHAPQGRQARHGEKRRAQQFSCVHRFISLPLRTKNIHANESLHAPIAFQMRKPVSTPFPYPRLPNLFA